MPKSKRNRVYALTNTHKKGFERKSGLFQDIRDCCDQYASLYIFYVENMRNDRLKDVRMKWKDSRFFYGKNRVIQLALGRTEAEEYKERLHTVSTMLKGNVGLLFTNREPTEVQLWFDKYNDFDYARAGFVTSQTISLEQGPLEQFAHSLEPHLRSLGLPTKLEKGKVVLTNDHEVCKPGDVLTPEQARIIKLLEFRLAKFHINLLAHWSQDGTVTMLNAESTSCHISQDEFDHEE